MIRLETGVAVIGGGIAGLMAALAAARNGARTLLVERYGFLGGVATAVGVLSYMPHEVDGKPLVGGLFAEFNRRLAESGGLVDNVFDPEIFKLVAADMLVESGVEVLLHTDLLSVRNEGPRIRSIVLKGRQELFKVRARTWIDATGDATLAAQSHARIQPVSMETMQNLTLMFRMAPVDFDAVFAEVREDPEDFFPWTDRVPKAGGAISSVGGYFRRVRSAREDGALPSVLEYVMFHTTTNPGEANFNTTRVVNRNALSTRDLSKAELEGRQQVHRISRFMRAWIPGFEKARVSAVGTQIGIRATRRIEGHHVMTREELVSGARFDDAIARGCYGIDIHHPSGGKDVMDDLAPGTFYEIPYRALVPLGCSNLLVVGRCLSATFEAQAALRIMATSAATGEAAGIAAAIAAPKRKEPIRVSVSEIRKRMG